MPWTAADADRHKKGLTGKGKRQWAHVANDARKRCIAKGGDAKECDASAIKQANSAVGKSQEAAVGQELQEAMTIDVGEGERVTLDALIEAYRQVQEAKPTKASDYLVVEDSKKPSSWHLPVKRNGKPDHNLMGAAWAALHEGYRGNKYKGPDKAKALSKLKALYKSEGMDLPTKTKELGEFDDQAMPDFYVPYTVMTFADLEAAEAAEAAADRVRRLTVQFREIVTNILWNKDVEDKIGTIHSLVDEYAILLEQKVEEGETEGDEEPTVEPTDELTELVENVTGTMTLAEDLPDPNDNRAPLLMDIEMIQPGWGNEKDMHYYPGDMLQRDAPVFVGAKMYATDHHQKEKSVRTEVAVIQSINGYTESGAPVARVAVHDPDFAEATRNRARLGTLETLECSILARGKTREGEVDGIKGHIVESITEAISVDFVTKAGAGGHAINLAEGGEPVKDDKKLKEKDPVQKDAPTQDDPPDATPPEVTMLEGEQVQALLSETNLPTAAKTRVAESEYRSEDEAKTAIQAEIEYVKALTGSGDVFAQGPGNPLDETPKMTEAEYDERFNDILVRHGLEPNKLEVDSNVN